MMETTDIRHAIVPYTRGRGLYVGSGEKPWPHVIACDTSMLELFADGALDFVIHETSEDDEASPLQACWGRVRLGGYLIVQGRTKEAPTGGWLRVMIRTGLKVYQKTAGTDQTVRHRSLRKTACVVRYGGFGDMLQAASVLPGLKKQGFHVVVMTTPKGQDIIRDDPHVDEWIIQDTNQVPQSDLGPYWAYWSKQFDRWVNLSESVEASMLAYPGRAPYFWNDEARRMRFGNAGYLKLQHAIADVPYKPAVRFYPAAAESEWAHAQKARYGDVPVILWALAGSSVHKCYPHMDAVIARLMLDTKAVVVLTGDPSCVLLEQGWENEPRVVRTSGQWSIRESLAFAQVSDIVIGPETGIMNAVAFEKNRKVLMLSHSSAANLCPDWINTHVLTPTDCPCHPCHKLHLSPDSCQIDEETGCSLCAVQIAPSRMFSEIKEALRKLRR